MFGIGLEWWILYCIIIVYGLCSFYKNLAVMQSYDQAYSLLVNIRDELQNVNETLNIMKHRRAGPGEDR